MASVNQDTVRTAFDDALVIDGLGGDIVPSRLSPLAAGITAVNATIASPHADFMDTARAVYHHMTLIEALPDKLVHVRTVADIHDAKRSRRLGVIFGLQDGTALGTELPLLTLLFQLGVRVMSLTYNERNALGDGCLEPHDQGITHFGVQAVREMNRLGILLDLSHCSERTSMDAMDSASRPPVFSHSNPKSLTQSPRCITDDQMIRVAELGGLVGISVYSPMTYSTPGVRPTLSDLLDRIEYAVDLIGIDHVGIGSDIFEGKNPILWRATTKRRYPEMVGAFDRDTIRVDGYEEHAQISSVAYGLTERGYPLEDTLKVMGGNWVRVLEDTIG